ncbi:MAG: cache domain-containing protein [Rhodoferax sp.]|nr:cache domain-containing protein [Rhodoferax sp.]
MFIPRVKPLQNLAKHIQIALVFLMLLALVWVLLLKDLNEMIELDKQAEQQQIENVADIGAKALQVAIQSLDLMLIDLRDHWHSEPGQFAKVVRQKQTHANVDFEFDINVISADGHLLFSTLDPAAVGLDLSDRPHFKALRDGGQDQLLLSPPQKAKTLDRVMVNFSRLLRTSTGQFDGVVILSVKPDYLTNLYDTLKLGQDGLMAVVRDDGVVLMRLPAIASDNAFTLTVPSSSASQADSFSVRRSSLDHIERRVAQRKAAGYPVKLLVGRPTIIFERIAQAHRMRYFISGGLISALLLLLLVLVWLVRHELLRARDWHERAEELDKLTKAQNELAASQTELRQLADHQWSEQELEHKRIAREIHDELGQRLTVLRMDVALLPRTVQDDPAGLLVGQVKALKSSIDDILLIVRDVVGKLRPSALDIGLAAATESLLLAFQTSMGIPCEIANNLPPDLVIDDRRVTVIYRILQESLTNVARHAQASRIQVMLAMRDQRLLLLKVTDDGRGYDPSAERPSMTFGLSGMRERAASLGGALNISSSPGIGTTVEVIIPMSAPTPGRPPALDDTP